MRNHPAQCALGLEDSLNPRRGADIREHARLAPWHSCYTDPAAMENQQVRNERPVIPWDERHENLFYFDGVSLVGESKPDTKPAHVSVDDNSIIDIECIAKHDVRSLSSHTGKIHQLFHCRGNVSAMTLGNSG